LNYRSSFEIYLRTGRRLEPTRHALQLKFNPWHDPDDGRFTFSGQGSYFRGLGASMAPEKSSSSTDPTTERSDLLRLAQFRPNPRARMGGNGGPPLYDPRTLEDAFPGLSRAPGGVVLSLADNFLDFTGPARAWTRELAVRHAKTLVQQIKALQPNYELNLLEPGGFPASADGQVNLINRLRFDRAKAFYGKGELRPLQIETLRFLQSKVDTAYEEGLRLLRSGRLPVRLSEREALGNFIDFRVRTELRAHYGSNGISIERGQSVQVNRRAHNVSERIYSVPDSRVGDVAFDVTLQEKSLANEQIRRFFRSDFQPISVVIVRPTQPGPRNTYVITRPKGL